jgi:hypothetical protein
METAVLAALVIKGNERVILGQTFCEQLGTVLIPHIGGFDAEVMAQASTSVTDLTCHAHCGRYNGD